MNPCFRMFLFALAEGRLTINDVINENAFTYFRYRITNYYETLYDSTKPASLEALKDRKIIAFRANPFYDEPTIEIQIGE